MFETSSSFVNHNAVFIDSNVAIITLPAVQSFTQTEGTTLFYNKTHSLIMAQIAS